MSTTANFGCSQEELILVCETGWNSCGNTTNLPNFFTFKPKYITGFITAKLNAVDAADTLPTDAQRKEAEETNRVILSGFNTTACANWQTLKRYITEAYPENLLQIKLNAAGMANYEPATNENWESSKSLLKLANQFITDNIATLTASDNMPTTFQTTFSDSKDDVDTALATFKAAESTAVTGTQTKTDALNAIFADLMSMFLDGQEIYKTNEAAKKQFTFEQVLKLVSGGSPQGFKGTVTSSLTGLPIDKVIVTVLLTKHTTIGNTAGIFAMRNVAHADDYTITFECDGYDTATFKNQKVAIGVMTTLDVQLVPAKVI